MMPSDAALPPDDLPQFEDKSRWLWTVLVLLAAAVLLGLVLAKPAYRQVKIWRAAKFVAEGSAALATNDLPTVSRAVRAAIGLAPLDPGVLRLTAQYCTRTGQAEGITYWQLLLKSKQATLTDRQDFTRFAQGLERLDLSGQLLQELIAEDAQNRTNQLLVLDQFALVGDWGRVVIGAEALLKEFPSDPELQLLLARAYLGSRDSARGAQAAELLRVLSRTEHPQRQAARRTFVTMFGPPPAELLLVANELEHATNATIADRLLAWEVRERLQPPTQRASVPDRARASLPADLIPEDAIIVVEWLRARRRFDLAIQLVPLTRARTAPGLLLAHGELLADLGRWSDLENLLREPKLPLNRVAIACLHAIHDYGSGHTDEAVSQLRGAAKAAGGSPPMLQQIAAFAEQMHQPAIATEIWTTLLQNPSTVVPASAVLLRQARQRDDLQLDHLVYRHLIVPLGQQSEVRFQHAYLSALFNENLVEAETTLADLLAHDLNNVRLRAALALAKLRLHKPAEALTVCESGDIDWSVQEPRWRVLYAAALQSNQQRAAARRFATAVPADRLKGPERTLLQEVLDHL